MGYMGRDVAVKLHKDDYIVMACDSSGAIGEKDGDHYNVSAFTVGRFLCRTALYELLTVGAEPILSALTISSEPNPTGDNILKGVQSELNTCGFCDIPMVISTEKNMPTSETGVGIAITGICSDRLRIGTTKKGDSVYVIGLPLMGAEVIENEDEMVSADHIKLLCQMPSIHDIIMVGSMGIKGEIENLCDNINLEYAFYDDLSVDVIKSGGPSTCAVVTVDGRLSDDDLEMLREIKAVAVNLTGKII